MVSCVSGLSVMLSKENIEHCIQEKEYASVVLFFFAEGTDFFCFRSMSGARNM